ncbi:MAG: hypothetical protein ACK5Q5_08870 [Planctomycetaceae bacterium]
MATGYAEEDFPLDLDQHADGCAYFAKERWLAEIFVGRRSNVTGTGYEDWLIEVRIPLTDYERYFQQFEHPITTMGRTTTEVAIPRQSLHILNQVGQRVLQRPRET